MNLILPKQHHLHHGTFLSKNTASLNVFYYQTSTLYFSIIVLKDEMVSLREMYLELIDPGTCCSFHLEIKINLNNNKIL